MKLTPTRLREVLAYSPQTGDFRWRVKTRKTVTGNLAGYVDEDGYRWIGIDGGHYPAHRLAFMWMTGKWPLNGFVDHKNGKPIDNRWSNLRDVTKQINQQNVRKARVNSKSGILGVSLWHGYWKATITANYKHHCLGYFKTSDAAAKAYLAAKRRLHEGCTI